MPEFDPSKRTLTREQVAEIIRANVAAFKDDPNFYDYLTELVIYLMEYEYAWDNTAVEKPGAARGGEAGGLTKGLNVTSAASAATDERASQKYRFEFIQPVGLTLASGAGSHHKCRVCGADMQGKLVCPNCLSRNRKQ